MIICFSTFKDAWKLEKIIRNAGAQDSIDTINDFPFLCFFLTQGLEHPRQGLDH